MFELRTSWLSALRLLASEASSEAFCALLLERVDLCGMKSKQQLGQL
jgi:hypothetical protein